MTPEMMASDDLTEEESNRQGGNRLSCSIFDVQ
jgi:hypothetical protein